MSHFFLAFISQVKVYCGVYCALYCGVVKQHMITTAIIFSCQISLLLINHAPLFKVVAFVILLFDVELSNLALFDAALMLSYFKVVLVDVPLFLSTLFWKIKNY